MASSSFADHVRFAFSRVNLSYLFDVIVLAIFAIAGGVFSLIPPTRRAFSLTDETIAFPYLHDTISIRVAFAVCVAAPAAIILLVCLLFITRKQPPPQHHTDDTHTSESKARPALVWRRKLWETFASIMGLAFSVILTFFVVQGAKNLFGKPRPDFLARCDPDLANYNNYRVGGYSSEALQGNSVHVLWEICQSRNGGGVGTAEFDDGFRSFPSGHCSIAFAGLFYLSLFLAAKFSVTIPLLAPAPFTVNTTTSPHPRSQAAAPPIYLFVLAAVPTGVATYIAATRFSDYKHHGFDVLISSLLGIAAAWFAFRWFHMPVRRGAGWAWGPRSNGRAFGIGVGVGGYHVPKSGDAAAQYADGGAKGRHNAADVENGGATATATVQERRTAGGNNAAVRRAEEVETELDEFARSQRQPHLSSDTYSSQRPIWTEQQHQQQHQQFQYNQR